MKNETKTNKTMNANLGKNKILPEQRIVKPDCTEFPSAELSLKVMINEYNRSFEASNSLTNRGGLLLSAILAAFLISISYINIGYIFQPPQDVMYSLLYYLLISVAFLFVTSGVLSIGFLIRSVTTMTFQGINCEKMDDKIYLAYSNDKVAKSIISAGNSCIKTSDINNKKRARYYNIGSWFGFSAVINFLLIVVLQQMLL